MVVRVISAALIILCLQISTICQSSWQIIDEDNAEMTIAYAIEVDETIVLLANKESFHNSEIYSHYIIQLSLNGDTIAQKDITIGEYFQEEAFIIIYNAESNTYSVQGEILEINGANKATYWYHQLLDSNFNEISFDLYEFSTPQEIELFTFYSNERYNVCVVESSIYNLFVITNHSGEVVSYREIPRFWLYKSVVIDDDDVITVMSDSIETFDIHLNRIEAKPTGIGRVYFPGQKMLLDSDKNFYYATKITEDIGIAQGFDFLLGKFDSTFTLQEYHVFPEHDLLSFPRNGLAFDHDGNLILGLLDFPMFIGDTWWHYFTITKYDKDLNELWSTYYNEWLSYHMRGLLPLSDGGVLVYGFHEDLYGEKDYPLLFKFDAEGKIITDVKEIEEDRIYIRVMGNPSDGIFRAQLENDISGMKQIVFHDVEGREIYKTDITSPSISLDLSHFSSGLYFFQIKQDGKALIGGKWVKR